MHCVFDLQIVDIDMADYKSDNKRIAVNTIVIYGRMAIVILVSILTTRFVIQALGVSDFGLYNVVGGVVGLLNFISISMSSTTARFINYEQGKPNPNLNKIFNICLVIHVLFAIVLLILAESLGIWYINNFLSVEPGKETDAMFVFQISTIVACIGLINVPYQSLLISYEKFLLSAILDIIVTLVKFGVVILLLFYNGNALRFYAIGMCVVTACSFVLYHVIAHKYWPEVIKHKFYRDRERYKEIFSFNNYNLLSTGAIISRNQGSNVIINYFFGTYVNGAFSVARNVQGFVDLFASNIDQAASPQIIQNYSKNNRERSFNLVGQICKFSLLLLLLVSIPLYAELDLVLQLWLKDVPDGAVTFCKYILLVSLVSSTSAGLIHLINATGRVKWFKIAPAILYFASLPLSVYLYHLGFPAYSILLLFVGSDVFTRIVQLALLKKYINFNVISFIKKAYLRPALIVIAAILMMLVYKRFTIDTIMGHLTGIAVVFLVVAVFVYLVGLEAHERQMINSKIKTVLKR